MLSDDMLLICHLDGGLIQDKCAGFASCQLAWVCPRRTRERSITFIVRNTSEVSSGEFQGSPKLGKVNAAVIKSVHRFKSAV